MGATISSTREAGTSTGGITPQSPRIIGTLAPPSWQITPDFLQPLTLPAKCLLASNLDSASDTEMESGSYHGSSMVPGEVCPPPSHYQDVSQNPSLRVRYWDLIPMTKLFTSWLPITEVEQRSLANFIQEWDIPLELCHQHENFKPVEGGTSAKDYNCLTVGCGRWSTVRQL